ncbi:sentrin-specific protease 7 isoform X2 [Amia ocellicauda]|uniref:sentrin-specific protease 7 isoform X2 n=1 Tax=Amia ocellicauda TaxID=2972642 RepID=UPI0034643B82
MDQRNALTISTMQEKLESSKVTGPFKIPKRKSSSDCMLMQSPLSRLSTSPKKIHWTQLSNTAKRAQAFPPVNRNRSQNSSQTSGGRETGSFKDARLVLTDVLTTDLGRGYLNRGAHIKQSGSAMNPSASRDVSELSPLPLAPPWQSCFSKSVRPRRASDSLVQQQNENVARSRLSLTLSLRRSDTESKASPPVSRRRIMKPGESNNKQRMESETKRSPGPQQVKRSPSRGPKRSRSDSSPDTDRPDRTPEEPQKDRRRSGTSTSQSNGQVQNIAESCRTSRREFVSRPQGQDSGIARKRLALGEPEQIPSPRGTPEQNTEILRERDLHSQETSPCGDHCEQSNGEKSSLGIWPSDLKNPQSSSEPIVLSSDEEEGSHSPSQSTSLTPDVKRLLIRIIRPPREPEPEPEPEPADIHKQCGETQHQEMEEDSDKDAKPASSDSTEETTVKDSALDLKFTALHFGKVKGEPYGCVQFKEDGITIPLKDPLGESLSLTVVQSELKRYGVWECTALTDHSEANTLLLLWVSPAQAQLIQKELSPVYPVEESTKASEFVLLELCEAADGQLCELLARLMGEMAQRNGEAGLQEPLSRAEGFSLLRKHTWYPCLLSLLGLDQGQSPEPDDSQSPQEEQDQPSLPSPQENSSLPIPRYTLCHRRVNNSFSISIALKPNKPLIPHQYRGPPTKLILFPPPPTKGGISVTSEDLECLENGEFLNDVIIDFYLKYLLLETAPKKVAERTHVFSSFFYKQLTRKDNPNEEAANISAQHRRHHRVKTWTRHIDIFTKDYLFVPVNQESHWYLAVICFPWLEEPQSEEWTTQAVPKSGPHKTCQGKPGGHTTGDKGGLNGFMKTATANRCGNSPDITGRTESSICSLSALRLRSSCSLLDCTQMTCQRERVCKRPCILIMDSLKLSSHERTVKLLRDYLQVEWEVRRGTPRKFTSEQMSGSHCRVPLQDNSSDCGIYLLQYVESFLQDPVVHFDLPLRLERWFPRQEVKRKRDKIRDLVLQLYSQQRSCT